MGFLNYTLSNFELEIGPLTLDNRTTELTISTGISEPEEWSTWKGSFIVRRTKEAIDAGLTDTDFSQLSTWGVGQHPVVLKLNGSTVAKLRIQEYTYNSYTRTGEGQLFQLLDLMDMERASEQVTEIRYGAGTAIKDVINGLLLKSGFIDGSQVVDESQIDLSAAPAEMTTTYLSAPFTTERPLQDAQDLAGKFWCWLWVDKDEIIRIKQRPKTSGTPLIYRTAKQVEPDTNPSKRNFATAHTIVTGTRQYTRLNFEYEDRDDPADEDDNDDGNEVEIREEFTDEQGRPRRVVTESSKNAYLLFPNRYSPLTTDELVWERKIIYYFYFDGDNAEPRVDSFEWALEFGSTDTLQAVQEELERIYQERDIEVSRAIAAGREPIPAVGEEPIATLALKMQLRESLFSGDRPADDLVYAEAQLETETEKIDFNLKGQLISGDFQKYYLIVENRESVTSGTTRVLDRKETETDPETGDATEKEPDPGREPPQLKSTFEVVTLNHKGEIQFKPLGFTEYLPRTTILDIGFCPSQEVAQEYAERFAHREQQRSRSELFQMPIPAEWIADGLSPFPIVYVGSGAYILEQPVIEITPSRCSLVWQGDRIGTLPTAIANLPDPKPITYTTDLFVAIPRNVFGVVGDAISNVQIVARNGTTPYTFSGTVPSGLALSSGGLISGTPTTQGASSSVITVTDGAAAVATTTVWFVIVGPQSPTLDYSEAGEFNFLIEIDFNLLPDRFGVAYRNIVEFDFDFISEDGDLTGGGGGY